VVPVPVPVQELADLARVHGVRPNATLSRSLTAFARRAQPDHRGFSVLAAERDAEAWAVEVEAAAVAVGLELPRERDARCPGCGQTWPAPHPLPAGWTCGAPHPRRAP